MGGQAGGAGGGPGVGGGSFAGGEGWGGTMGGGSGYGGDLGALGTAGTMSGGAGGAGMSGYGGGGMAGLNGSGWGGAMGSAGPKAGFAGGYAGAGPKNGFSQIIGNPETGFFRRNPSGYLVRSDPPPGYAAPAPGPAVPVGTVEGGPISPVATPGQRVGAIGLGGSISNVGYADPGARARAAAGYSSGSWGPGTGSGVSHIGRNNLGGDGLGGSFGINRSNKGGWRGN
jgi:hypothetical protein